MRSLYRDLPEIIHGIISSRFSSFMLSHSAWVMLGVPCLVAEMIGVSLFFSGEFLIDKYLLQQVKLRGIPVFIFIPAQVVYIAINSLFLLPVFNYWNHERKSINISPELQAAARNRVYNYPVFLIGSTYFVWASGAIVYSILYYSDLLLAELIAGLLSTVLNAILVYYSAELLNRFFFIPHFYADGKVKPDYTIFRKPSLFQRFWDLYLVNGIFPALSIFGVIFITMKYGTHDPGELFRLMVSAFIVGSVYLGFGFILTFLTAQSFMIPLKNLSRAANDLSNEVFQSRVIVQSDDQLGQLQMVMNKMGQVLQEKNTMKTLFGHYVSPVVRDLILDGKINTRGDKIEAVVLFSDIRSFTAMSEKYRPELVV